jgi:hypothetical protein
MMGVRFPYSPARTPPIPAVVLDLATPDGSRAVPDVSAHLDTAADRTVVPLALVHQLGLQPDRQLTAQGFGGAAYTLGVYRVRLAIAGLASVLVEALGHGNEPFVLVGRDVLNYWKVTFDGPNQVVEFH